MDDDCSLMFNLAGLLSILLSVGRIGRLQWQIPKQFVRLTPVIGRMRIIMAYMTANKVPLFGTFSRRTSL